MEQLSVINFHPFLWALSQSWASRPLSPSQVPPASPPPSPSGMSAKAKAFTIDALLGESPRQDLPVSPPLSPISFFREDSNDAALRDAPGKLKRHRTVFTESQLQRLEEEFERNQYLVGPERRYLATKLQLSELQLKVWFQNRRIKYRKNQRCTEESSTCSSSSDSE